MRENRNDKWIVVGCAWILAFTIACEGGSDESPEVTAADVREEAREAVDTATDYAANQVASQRKAVIDRVQRAVDEVTQELSDARDQVEQVSGEAREHLENAIDRAERAQKSLGEELDGLQQSGAAKWETARKRVDAAMAEMDEARREVSAALMGEKGPSASS